MRLYGKFVRSDNSYAYMFYANAKHSNVYAAQTLYRVYSRFNKSAKNVKNDWKVYNIIYVRIII